jgi:hypothetical protein
MAEEKKNPKHVDYEKDLYDWMRTGVDKVSGRIKKVEDLKRLKHTPEALGKMAVAHVGAPFAAMASGAVNKYKDVSENKKEPSIYSRRDDSKEKKPVSPAPMRTVKKAAGGSVRGAGKATKGVRKAKIC